MDADHVPGSRDIDRQKGTLLDEMSRRLEEKSDYKPLFALRWRVM